MQHPVQSTDPGAMSAHFEIVDRNGRCATAFKFTNAADAGRFLTQLRRINLYVAEVTMERKVKLIEPSALAA